MSGFRGHWAKELIAAAVALLVLMGAAAVSAASLHVPGAGGTRGEIITLPVIVDRAESLAGIKLELAYDADILKFIKAEKTSLTSNMLHVVNDRTPGKLVIVMAAARGFTAEAAPLVEMTFELLRDVKEDDNVSVRIIGAELMDQALKRIEVERE